MLRAAAVWLACAGSMPAPAQDDDGLRWLSSYKEAVAEARRSGQPIFLEYRCEP
jgi:hypothetical protein